MVPPRPEDASGSGIPRSDQVTGLVPAVPIPALAEDDRPGLHVRLFGSHMFFRLWLAQVMSSLGDWLGFLAIIIVATRVGASSGAASVGVVMIARILPGFFLAPLAGVMVDRWDRKRVMVACDVGRAAVLVTLPFVDTIVGLVLASLVMEVLTLMWSPAKEASVPNMVPPDRLTSANSLSLAAAYGTFPIASALFALLAKVAERLGNYEALDALRVNQEALAFYFDVGTFLLSALIISRLALPRPERAEGEKRRADLSQTFHELKEGWRYIFGSPVVRSVNVGLATGLIGGAMVVPLGSVFSTDVLGAGPAGFGIFTTALGFGVCAGVLALSITQKRVRKARVFTGSLFLAGAALIAAASMSSLTPAALLVFVLGMCAGSVYVLGFTLLHENTEDELRGRVFSALYTLVRLCVLIAFAVGPFLAELLNRVSRAIFDDAKVSVGPWEVPLPGVRLTLWLAGGIILGAGVLSFWSLRGLRSIKVPQRVKVRLEKQQEPAPRRPTSRPSEPLPPTLQQPVADADQPTQEPPPLLPPPSSSRQNSKATKKAKKAKKQRSKGNR